MPVVLIPTAYRAPTQGKAEIQVEGTTVAACLQAVEDAHPGFRELVLDPKGSLHPFVKLFVNEEQLGGDALDTLLASDDRLEVLAAIAGG